MDILVSSIAPLDYRHYSPSLTLDLGQAPILPLLLVVLALRVTVPMQERCQLHLNRPRLVTRVRNRE